MSVDHLLYEGFVIVATVILGATVLRAEKDPRCDETWPTLEPPKTERELRRQMTRLWEEHIAYSRSFFVSFLSSLEDAGALSARLGRAFRDTGNILKPYYGKEAAERFTSLLTVHREAAVPVLKAAKARNPKALEEAFSQWEAHADEAAAFLHGLNEHWGEEDLKGLLRAHMAAARDSIAARVKWNWDDDIDAYDRGHTCALDLADYLADGIIAQFPDRFGRNKAK
jgi:hypothetical protein